ncbi:MAG: hypothetical protein AAF721_00200 [Myxococcota bacterium]
MRAHEIASIAAAWCAVACRPDVELIEWEPLDVDAVRFAVDNPTARFADDPEFDALRQALTGPSTAADVDAATSGLRDFLDQGTPPEMDESNEGDEPPAGSGTSVFLKVACAGPDPNAPDRTFEFGQIRVDSPRLTREVIENLSLEGDLLLSFVRCSVDGVTYDGVAPSSYLAGDAPQLATSLVLEVLDEAEGTTEPFEREALFEPMRSRFVQPSAGGGTYTQELDAAAGTASLRAVDGVLQCTTATGVCTGP